MRALDQIKSVFYVQRAIDHAGRDLRIFVVGGRVIGAIERRAPAGEWHAKNVAIGGSATAVAVTHEIKRIVLTAAAAVGADYAGVDVLPARDGSAYVLEVNGIPGWQGLQGPQGSMSRPRSSSTWSNVWNAKPPGALRNPCGHEQRAS